jgi:hypothetical protein
MVEQPLRSRYSQVQSPARAPCLLPARLELGGRRSHPVCAAMPTDFTAIQAEEQCAFGQLPVARVRPDSPRRSRTVIGRVG